MTIFPFSMCSLADSWWPGCCTCSLPLSALSSLPTPPPHRSQNEEMKKEGGGGSVPQNFHCQVVKLGPVWGQTSLFTQIRPTKIMFWFQTSHSYVFFQIDKKCHWLLRQKLWWCHWLLEQKFSPMSQKNVCATSETTPTISNRVLPDKKFSQQKILVLQIIFTSMYFFLYWCLFWQNCDSCTGFKDP